MSSWFDPYGYAQYGPYAVGVAQQNGIDPNVFLNQIAEESGFNQYRTSPAGAVSIAQIMPGTASNPGYGLNPVDVSNPYAAIDFMGQYDAYMLGQTGSYSGMLGAYNGGLGNAYGTQEQQYASDILGGKWNSNLGLGSSTFTNTGNSNVPASGGIMDQATNWISDMLTSWGLGPNGIPGSPLGAAATPQNPATAAANAAGQAAGNLASQIGQAITQSLDSVVNTIGQSINSKIKTDLPAFAVGIIGIIFIIAALFMLMRPVIKDVAPVAIAAA